MPTYNKLVRDLIPAIISSRGSSCETRILDSEDFRAALRMKLQEEVEEYLSAGNDKEAVEELADIMELLHTLAEVHGSSIEQLEAVRAQKAEERGGFKERVFLVEVQDA